MSWSFECTVFVKHTLWTFPSYLFLNDIEHLLTGLEGDSMCLIYLREWDLPTTRYISRGHKPEGKYTLLWVTH